MHIDIQWLLCGVDEEILKHLNWGMHQENHLQELYAQFLVQIWTNSNLNMGKDCKRNSIQINKR